MYVHYGILYLAMTRHKLAMRCLLQISVKMLLLIYFLFFKALDWGVGEVFDALKDTNMYNNSGISTVITNKFFN